MTFQMRPGRGPGGTDGGTGGSGGGGGTPKPAPTPKPKPAPVQTPQQKNPWAFRKPQDIQELLRQLSANVGQEFLPYGPGGDVRQPAFGSPQPAQMNINPATYGETGGETNFFQTTLGGGMAPISSVPRQVTNWDPLGLFKTADAKTKSIGGSTGSDRGYSDKGKWISKNSAPATPAAPAASLTQDQLMALLQSIFATQ